MQQCHYYKSAISPNEPPTVFGFTPLTVMSGSMNGDAEDHTEVGDLIFINKVAPENLQVGDIIAFQKDSSLITLRIIEITISENGDLQFLTKGDANNIADTDPIEANPVVGIFKTRIPKLSDFVVFVQPPVSMLIIGVPVATFLIYDVIHRQKYANKAKAKNAAQEAELELGF